MTATRGISHCLTIVVASLGLVASLAAGEALGQSKLLIAVKDKPGPDGKDTPLHVKVIVKTETAKIHKEPGDSTGQPVDFFDVFFQLLTDDNQPKSGAWVRVGNESGKPYGWIEEKHLLLWKSRYALEPIVTSGAEKFKVYNVKDRTQVDAILKKPPTGKRVMAPILEKPEIARIPMYNIAYFAGRLKTLPGKDSTPNDQPLPEQDLKLEIVFVIDTTASMTPLLKGAKDTVRLATEQLTKMEGLKKGAVRFGLVEYQDDVPGLVNSRLVSPLTDDFKTFREKLDALEEAKISSIDTPEQVLAGLREAIDNGGWTPNSARHIFLLGDASGHLGDKDVTKLHSIEAIIDRAWAAGGSTTAVTQQPKRLHAIRAINDADLVDAALCKAQFQQIAANNKRYQGLYEELNPNDKKDIDRVVTKLAGLMKGAFVELQDIRRGQPRQDPGNHNPISDSFYEILNAQGGANIEPLKEGWAFERENGHLVAHRKVFVLEKELKILKSNLEILHESFGDFVDPKDRPNVGDVLEKLQRAVTNTVSGQTFRKDVPLKDVLSQLPLTTDALDKTPEKLQGLSESAFKNWLGSLKSAIIRADKALEDQRNWQQLSSVDPKKKCAILLQSQLP